VERCISPEESKDLALCMSRKDLAQTFLFAADDFTVFFALSWHSQSTEEVQWK